MRGQFLHGQPQAKPRSGHGPAALLALLLHLLLAPAALLLAPNPAQAAESAPVVSPRTRMTLVAEPAAIAPGQPFQLGLQEQITPGWHTYWKNAGDAGTPPEISFTLPQGGTAGPFEWPTPSRISYGPLVDYGYHGQVLLPLTLTPPATLHPGDTYTIIAHASWLVCSDVCIPEEGQFTLNLPVEATARPDPALAVPFAATEASLPRPSPWQASAGAAGADLILRLTGPGLSAAMVKGADFFPASFGAVENAAPQRLGFDAQGLTLSVRRPDAPVPARLQGVVVLTDASGQRSGYSLDIPMGPAPAPAPPAGAAVALVPLWQAVGFALLGGLLLNLMPCVFPILAMKAIALARLGGTAQRGIRQQAGGYTLGVVLTFLVLAALLLALRAAGHAIGWGFQFTSPVFTTAMAWLMLGVGLNLSGVFAVRSPGIGLGNGSAGDHGFIGSIFTGVVAVLVAAPCSAPFMATAIGAALALPALATLLIFLALGLGLAAPSALLALFPRVANWLPRPGAWMETLRQALAFPMYAAAAWLAWVVAQQAGDSAMLAVLAGALLLALAGWAWGHVQGSHNRSRAASTARLIGRIVALLALAGTAALLPVLHSLPPIGTASASPASGAGLQSEAWSAARVAALQAEGRPVFVNFTAAWCISCQVNDRVALETAAVQQAFKAHNIAYLKGDWTNGDPAITQVIHDLRRDGVPLYLYYPAGGGAPIILPQILTESVVLHAIGAQ